MHEGFAYGFARVRLIIKATLKLLWYNRRQRTKKYAMITRLQAENHIGTSITIQKVVLTAVPCLKATSPFQTPCSTRQASLGIHIHARGICDRVPGIPLQLLIEHDSHAVWLNIAHLSASIFKARRPLLVWFISASWSSVRTLMQFIFSLPFPNPNFFLIFRCISHQLINVTHSFVSLRPRPPLSYERAPYFDHQD